MNIRPLKTPLVSPPIQSQEAIEWFLQLRRIAAFAQGVIILWAVCGIDIGLNVSLPLFTLLLFPFGELLYRSLSFSHGKPRQNRLLGVLLVWDSLTLTLLLALTGGPTNPFSILYLVQVVLSAVLLRPLWTWGLTALTSGLFFLLFFTHKPLEKLSVHGNHVEHSFHLKGMLLSYALVAALIAYFLHRIISERRQAERDQLSLLHAQKQLTSMTALTTDAAHRLGTPLGSLYLIAHELKQHLSGLNHWLPESVSEDLDLLCSEALRCKNIITELCQSSGSFAGESPKRITVGGLLEDLNSRVSGEVEFEVALPLSERSEIVTQVTPLSTALISLISNAERAQKVMAVNTPVRVFVEVSPEDKNNSNERGMISFTVVDQGPGMTPKELLRVTEPFYSTDSGGMGLGAYVAELIAEQLGGRLEYRSKVGVGTRVTLTIPSERSEAHAVSQVSRRKKNFRQD